MGAQAVGWVVTAGVLAVQLAPWRLPPAALAAAAGALLGGWAVVRRPALGWLAVGLAAGAASALRLAAVDTPALAPHHVARMPLPVRTVLEGDVEEIRRTDRGRATIVVRATAVTRDGARRPATGRVRLTVRAALPKLRPGDALRADTRLRAPRNFANPGSFDLVGHLARRDIRVTAAVWDAGRLERLPRRTRGVTVRLRRWRERLGRVIARTVPAPRAAVLQALVLGDDDRIAPELRQAFNRAGVVHVLSVSGLHVGLVAVASFAAVRWLCARSVWLLLALDVRRAAALVSLGPVAFYAALAGLEVATLRSALMVGCGVLALLVARRLDVLRALALAAVAVALARPGAPREIGFQLSFVSVAALVLGARRWAAGGTGRRRRLRTTIVVAAAALAGTAPLTALHFQQVSPMGLVANPLVVPLLGSIVVVVGLLAAAAEPVAPALAGVLFGIAGELVRPGLALVEALARPAWAAFDVPRPTALELALLYGALVGLACPAGRTARCLAAASVIGLLVDAGMWARARWAPGELRVTFLDVGQGDAAVAELPDGRVLVVDAGGFPGSDFDTGAAIVSPYLATRKIRRIDTLVMTHAHPDHAGGLASLLGRHHPRELWWSGWPGRGVGWQQLVDALAASGVPARVKTTGDTLAGSGDGVTVLHPPAGWSGSDLNDSSLTLRLTHGAVSVLLTGDIEARAESSLVAARAPLAAAVLKVPHHGSRTSSTAAFGAAVAPRIAVVSVGADNRYRLPAPEVEARYRAQGACVLRTDRCGAVTVTTDGRRLTVTTARAECACPHRGTGAPRGP